MSPAPLHARRSGRAEPTGRAAIPPWCSPRRLFVVWFARLVQLGPDDHPNDFFVVGSALPPHADAASGAHDGDAVGDRKNVREVVADEHDGVASCLKLHDELEHELLLLDAEGSGWLIEDHDAAVLRHRSADRDSLALAAGEVADQRMDRGMRM